MSDPDPEVPPIDAQQQATPVEPEGGPLAWDDVDRELDGLPAETPEADAVDQMRPVDSRTAPVSLPGRVLGRSDDLEVPEADAIEQSMPVIDDDDDRRPPDVADQADRW